MNLSNLALGHHTTLPIASYVVGIKAALKKYLSLLKVNHTSVTRHTYRYISFTVPRPNFFTAQHTKKMVI